MKVSITSSSLFVTVRLRRAFRYEKKVYRRFRIISLPSGVAERLIAMRRAERVEAGVKDTSERRNTHA